MSHGRTKNIEVEPICLKVSENCQYKAQLKSIIELNSFTDQIARGDFSSGPWMKSTAVIV